MFNNKISNSFKDFSPDIFIDAIENFNCPFVFASYKRSNEDLEFVYSDFIVPQKVSYTDILKTNSFLIYFSYDSFYSFCNHV